MFKALTRWRHQRIIHNSIITEFQWQRAFAPLPLLDRLTADQKKRLQELAILLLHQKKFSGAHDLVVTQEMKLTIALQACLPVVNLDIGWYRNWVSIIVYPEGFATEQTMIDELGITHRVRRALSGEAWQRGPVILSWKDAEHAGVIDGSNLVIHEFVHKLDMLNGKANGFPPLHKSMDKHAWSRVFAVAYEDFQQRLFEGDTRGIDPYAGHSPAEFLAVLSEVFFERPELLSETYPDVYRQLCLFFKWEPCP